MPLLLVIFFFSLPLDYEYVSSQSAVDPFLPVYLLLSWLLGPCAYCPFFFLTNRKIHNDSFLLRMPHIFFVCIVHFLVLFTLSRLWPGSLIEF